MKLKRLIVTLAAAVMLSGAAIGCTEADQVSSNISKQADNFNVTRKLTVLNARTDTVLLELTGTFALKNNSSNELEVIIETAEGKYQKDYNDSAQKTPAVRKNVRGMNAPITNNATIIPTGFSSGIVGFSWPDVLQNAVIRCIALLFQEKHFR